MTDYVATHAQPARPPIDSNEAGQTIALVGEFDIANTDGGNGLAQNDTIELVKLPPGHVPVDATLDTDSLDSGSTATVDVGDLSSGGSGDELIAGDAVAQGGGLKRMDQKDGTKIAPDATAERAFGVTVASAVGTPTTSGKVRLTLLARAADHGI